MKRGRNGGESANRFGRPVNARAEGAFSIIDDLIEPRGSGRLGTSRQCAVQRHGLPVGVSATKLVIEFRG